VAIYISWRQRKLRSNEGFNEKDYSSSGSYKSKIYLNAGEKAVAEEKTASPVKIMKSKMGNKLPLNSIHWSSIFKYICYL
jgi:hypothetical protein